MAISPSLPGEALHPASSHRLIRMTSEITVAIEAAISARSTGRNECEAANSPEMRLPDRHRCISLLPRGALLRRGGGNCRAIIIPLERAREDERQRDRQ